MNYLFVFGRRCKVRQLATILFSSFLLLFYIYFVIFQFSYNTAMLFILGASIFVYINELPSKIYEVKIEAQRMIVQNMWKSFQHPLTDLVDVRPVRFVVPYPINPFLKFVFKNGNSYISNIPNPLKYYLRQGGKYYWKEIADGGALVVRLDEAVRMAIYGRRHAFHLEIRQPQH